MVSPDNPDCFWGSVPVDEWTYCEKLRQLGEEKGTGEALVRERLERHWDSWVTEEDIATLAAAGLTHLRVPVGHWLLRDAENGGERTTDEPYLDAAWPYLLRLFSWSRTHGLEVWLDLHTAPGSQNGFDNSGHFGNLTWGNTRETVEQTVAAVGRLSRGVADAGYGDVVTGFGALNEPGPYLPVPLLENYYEDAYAAVRAQLPNATVYIGDVFNSRLFANFWTGKPTAHDPRAVGSMTDETGTSVYRATYPITGEAGEGGDADGPGDAVEAAADDTPLAGRPAFWEVGNVALDTHIYHCFTPSMRKFTPREHIEEVCGGDRKWLLRCCDGANATGSNMLRMVGEWTLAYDQEPGPALEARGPRPMTPERAAFLKSYAMAQMVTFEETNNPDGWGDDGGSESGMASGAPPSEFVGWFYWNFKMEAEVYEEWSYLAGLEGGWIPSLSHGEAASQSFGDCASIAAATPNHHGVVQPFPPPSWTDPDADDSVPSDDDDDVGGGRGVGTATWLAIAVVAAATACWCVHRARRRREEEAAAGRYAYLGGSGGGSADAGFSSSSYGAVELPERGGVPSTEQRRQELLA